MFSLVLSRHSYKIDRVIKMSLRLVVMKVKSPRAGASYLGQT